ncbi:non-ribosomal peptide synthetase, partial [Paenibacillus sp. LMG 31461]
TELLQYPTIDELANYLDTKPEEEVKELMISPAAEAEYYPLSSAQMRLFIHNQMVGGTAYNLPRVLIIEGQVDLEHMKECLVTLVNRHETLRTSFHVMRGEYVQRVYNKVDFQVEYIETKDSVFTEEHLNNFVRPFDLMNAPLFRAKIIHFSDTKFALLLDMHHIISDRASMIILMKEFTQLYECKQIPNLSIHYKDYAVWQMKFMGTETMKKQEEYWINTFADGTPSTEFKTDYSKDLLEDFEEKLKIHEIDEYLKEKIIKFSGSSGTTRNMLFFAVYNLLIWKWTGSEDICIGTSTLGRNFQEVENIVGMFVNTLAIRNYPAGHKTFAEFLTETKENLINAYANQDYPYELLVEKLRSKHKTHIDSLFKTMFIMQNMRYPELKMGKVKVEPYYIPTNTRFDLQFDIFEAENELINLCFMYSRGLYKDETIQKLMSAYMDILTVGIDNPNIKLCDIVINL